MKKEISKKKILVQDKHPPPDLLHFVSSVIKLIRNDGIDSKMKKKVKRWCK